MASACLFEIPPFAVEQIVPAEMKSGFGITETRLVMEATAPNALDPLLEQATLEELNSALSKVVIQTTGRVAGETKKDMRLSMSFRGGNLNSLRGFKSACRSVGGSSLHGHRVR
jgi:hypothetical protein